MVYRSIRHAIKRSTNHDLIYANISWTRSAYGLTILSHATSLGAPSYGGVRTCLEGSQARGNGRMDATLPLVYKNAHRSVFQITLGHDHSPNSFFVLFSHCLFCHPDPSWSSCETFVQGSANRRTDTHTCTDGQYRKCLLLTWEVNIEIKAWDFGRDPV